MTDIVPRLRDWLDEDTPIGVIMNEAADEIERLRAECFSLAAWQCVYTDGKTGLVCGEHGNQYCAMTKEADRLRAENAELEDALKEAKWDLEMSLKIDKQKDAHIAELIKALQWYAEGGEFRLGFDNGDIARTALAKMEDKQ